MPFKPFAFAALYSAAIISIAVSFGSGGGAYGIAHLIFPIVFFVAFSCALSLSPIFYYARKFLPEFPYFLLHLAIGVGIGAIRAASNPYASDWHHYVYNPNALLVSVASLAAWLYVFIYTNPRQTSFASPGDWKKYLPPALLLGVIIAPIPIGLAPVPEDPSCHNSFRGDRTRVSPSVRLEFRLHHLSDVELESFKEEVSELYDNFATEFDLSVTSHPLLPESTQRSICNDEIIISAGGTFSPGRHGVSIYEHIGAKDWEPLASELVCRIERKWNGVIVFTGKRGEDISKPEYLLQDCASRIF